MSTNFEPEEWISQSEAARLRAVSRQAIAKLVRSQRVKTMAIGGRILVRRDDILRFLPKKAGRPKSAQ